MIAKSNLPAEQDISTFSFHNNSIRCILINGEPWFCLKDVCGILLYKNSREAIRKHVSPKDVTKRDTLTKGGKQAVSYVNESGLYCLIFGSKLQAAEEFKKWVT